MAEVRDPVRVLSGYARHPGSARAEHSSQRLAGLAAYDAFGIIGTTFRNLKWKTQFFAESAALKTPNESWWTAAPPPAVSAAACSNERIAVR